MLAIVTIEETEQVVYTVPEGKKAFVFLSIFAPEATEAGIVVKVNSYVYYSDTANYMSLRMILDAGDVVSVQTDDVVNVFVEGFLI